MTTKGDGMKFRDLGQYRRRPVYVSEDGSTVITYNDAGHKLTFTGDDLRWLAVAFAKWLTRRGVVLPA